MFLNSAERDSNADEIPLKKRKYGDIISHIFPQSVDKNAGLQGKALVKGKGALVQSWSSLKLVDQYQKVVIPKEFNDQMVFFRAFVQS